MEVTNFLKALYSYSLAQIFFHRFNVLFRKQKIRDEHILRVNILGNVKAIVTGRTNFL